MLIKGGAEKIAGGIIETKIFQKYSMSKKTVEWSGG